MFNITELPRLRLFLRLGFMKFPPPNDWNHLSEQNGSNVLFSRNTVMNFLDVGLGSTEKWKTTSCFHRIPPRFFWIEPLELSWLNTEFDIYVFVCNHLSGSNHLFPPIAEQNMSTELVNKIPILVLVPQKNAITKRDSLKKCRRMSGLFLINAKANNYNWVKLIVIQYNEESELSLLLSCCWCESAEYMCCMILVTSYQMKIVPGEVNLLRDFAERLSLWFNNAIQTKHFGNTLTVSNEGIAVWFFPPSRNGDKPNTDFFTHLSDTKQYYSSVVYNHMVKLIKYLMKEGITKKGSRLIESSDGCAAQYWCTTAFYFLSSIALD